MPPKKAPEGISDVPDNGAGDVESNTMSLKGRLAATLYNFANGDPRMKSIIKNMTYMSGRRPDDDELTFAIAGLKALETWRGLMDRVLNSIGEKNEAPADETAPEAEIVLETDVVPANEGQGIDADSSQVIAIPKPRSAIVRSQPGVRRASRTRPQSGVQEVPVLGIGNMPSEPPHELTG